MQPYASVYTFMHPSRIDMQPHASICVEFESLVLVLTYRTLAHSVFGPANRGSFPAQCRLQVARCAGGLCLQHGNRCGSAKAKA